MPSADGGGGGRVIPCPPRCRIVRWVDDEPRPGLVEVRFTDAHDRQRVFVERSAVVSEAHLSSGSRYPVDAGILCDTLNGDAEDTPAR